MSNHWIYLATFGDYVSFSFVKSILEEANIVYIVENELSFAFSPFDSFLFEDRIRILVHKENIPEAIHLLTTAGLKNNLITTDEEIENK